MDIIIVIRPLLVMPCLNPKEGTVNGEMQVFFGQLGRYAEAW